MSRCSIPPWTVTLYLLVATSISLPPMAGCGSSSSSGATRAAPYKSLCSPNLLRDLLATSSNQSSSPLLRSSSSLWDPSGAIGLCLTRLSLIHLLILDPLEACDYSCCASAVAFATLLWITSAVWMPIHSVPSKLRLQFGHLCDSAMYTGRHVSHTALPQHDASLSPATLRHITQ